MKITNRPNLNPIEPPKRKAAEQADRPEVQRSAGDSVKLSDTAQKILQAKAERIAAIKEQIEEGTYDVDLDRLAEAIARREASES